ncbi:MAG: filamentous hemagglutinin N-terminal domain-containing protein [Leptolyngbya sp. SIOISBB]|nr:filamentous hemagglutinin N-terminal domain-containing protein [Leptolyngbya sp. SIOISBB]
MQKSGASLAVIFCLTTVLATPAAAQLVPDNTLGNESSLVTPDILIDGLPVDLLEGGAERGSNLFHSFLEFNIDEGQRVYFANPAAIENILSRVTGGDPSNIFGTLGVEGPANLFLLNPNGIVFGPEATLDIIGSFHASTADAIAIGEGVYSATAPEQSSLLTVDPSIALTNYLNDESGGINNQGQLAAQGDLTLAANNLDLQGQVAAGGELMLLGLDTVQIRDSVETPFIGFAGGDLLVQGNEQVDIVALSHPDSGLYSYGDIVLRSANPVGGDAHYWSAGSFQVETLDGAIGDLYSPIDPVIRALGDVRFNGYQGNSLHVIAAGAINIGSIIIAGAEAGIEAVNFLQEDIQLSNGLQAEVNGSFRPTLDLRSGVTPEAVFPIGSTGLLGGTFINPISGLIEPPPDTDTTATSADITVGEIAFEQPDGQVLISNQYQPNPFLEGGDITISGEGPLFDGINIQNLGGNGGNVYIDSRRSINFPGTFINTSSTLENGGDVYLIAEDTIALTDGAVISANGQQGGFISLEAETISLINNSAINSNTLGEQGGGDVSITGERFNLQNSSLIGLITVGSGNGGNLLLDVREFSLENRSQLSTATFSFVGQFGGQFDLLGQGSAGDIIVKNAESVKLSDNALIGTLSVGQGDRDVGSAGDIFIDTNTLDAQNQSGILASTLVGQGNSGNILIEVDGTVNFDNRSLLFTSSFGVGIGGNITIRSEELSFQEGSNATSTTFNPTTVTRNSFDTNLFPPEAIDLVIDIINTSDFDVVGQSNSGKLSIDSDSIVLSGISNENGARSGLFTETFSGGDAGEISIKAERLQILDGAGISSSTEGEGNGSTITVNAETVEIRGGASGSFPSALFSESNGVDTFGDAGDIFLNVQNLSVEDGGLLSASTFGSGAAGNVQVTADLVTVAGVGEDQQRISTIQSISGIANDFTPATGSAGNMSVTTGSLSIEGGGTIRTSTFGQGGGGDLNIVVNDAAEVTGSASLATGPIRSLIATGTTGSGNAGDLSLNVGEELTVRNGAGIIASTRSSGAAGEVKVTADLIEVIGVSDDRFFFSDIGSTSVPVAVGAIATGAAGDVTISSRLLSIRDGGQISTGTASQGAGGTLSVTATESTELVGSGISLAGFTETEEPIFGATSSGLNTQTTGTANAGNLRLETGQLSIQDGATIDASTFGVGNAGKVEIAADSISLSGIREDEGLTSTIQSISGLANDQTPATGNAGAVYVTAGSLSIEDGGTIRTTTVGEGDGGNLDIAVNGAVEVTGSASLTTGPIRSLIATGTTGSGNAGDLSLNVGEELAVRNGAGIIASTTSSGAAGEVKVTADSLEVVEVSGDRFFFSDIGSTSVPAVQGAIATGSAGDVTIFSRLLSVRDGGQISTETASQGVGGTLSVIATEATELIGSGILLTGFTETEEPIFGATSSGLNTQTTGTANAGNLRLETGTLSIRDGAVINASTFDRGDAGDVEVLANAIEIVGIREDQLIFSGIQSISGQVPGQPPATGAAGNVAVTTQQLTIEGRGIISTVTLGEASPGSIELNVGNRLEMRDSDISTTALQAAGGDIQINTTPGFESGTIVLRGDSNITTSSQRDGGDITILGGAIVAFDDSDILTTSEDGTGGDIILGNFFSELDPFNGTRPFNGNNRVDVNAEGSLASGNISTPDVSFIENSLNELSGEIVDTTTLTAGSCIARSEDTEGSFVVTGGEGLPQQPGGEAVSAYPTGTVQTIPETTAGTALQEPQSVYRLADGRLVLSHECE